MKCTEVAIWRVHCRGHKFGSMKTTPQALVPIQLRNGNHLDSGTDHADGGNGQISDG